MQIELKIDNFKFEYRIFVCIYSFIKNINNERKLLEWKLLGCYWFKDNKNKEVFVSIFENKEEAKLSFAFLGFNDYRDDKFELALSLIKRNKGVYYTFSRKQLIQVLPEDFVRYLFKNNLYACKKFNDYDFDEDTTTTVQRLVLAIRRPLKEEVHHLNNISTDNDIDNLQTYSKEIHNKIHSYSKEPIETGYPLNINHQILAAIYYTRNDSINSSKSKRNYSSWQNNDYTHFLVCYLYYIKELSCRKIAKLKDTPSDKVIRGIIKLYPSFKLYFDNLKHSDTNRFEQSLPQYLKKF